MDTHQETTLSEFTPETDEIDITRTIRVILETSQQKLDTVRTGIDAYQQVAAHMADVLPSYPAYEWNLQNTQMYHQAKRGLPDDETNYKTTLAQMAKNDVVESYTSWRERGDQGESPKGQYGDADYLALRHDDCELHENDRGWGVKTRFISRNSVWFHLRPGDYQREFLERVTDSDDPASAGSAELHLTDGDLYLHQTITWPVEVYQAADVSTTVGVDLNDDPLVCVAVLGADGVSAVEMESGAEYRHHRERVKQRRAEAMQQENLKAVKDARLQYRRYTDHITNVASKRVVDIAETHAPAAIHIEDLTHYRETAKNPIHDWPFAEIQEKVAYKAREAGIPVESVDPRNTSTTCRECGETNPAMRDGDEFKCWECGYEVHADVNAAINIAGGGVI
jgi:IS605 OrfB family transposase